MPAIDLYIIIAGIMTWEQKELNVEMALTDCCAALTYMRLMPVLLQFSHYCLFSLE